MTRRFDMLLTAVAPVIWGSSYIVTTQFLPEGYPITLAVLRALPAGLLLLLISRQMPTGIWWGRSFLLGGLNFSFFWVMLFIAAYRLPGGVAATVGAVQPLIVIFLARFFLGSKIRLLSVIAAVIGMIGVALLLMKATISLDTIGIVAAFAGAFSMAAGTVLSRYWRVPVSLLTFTAWQLVAGGFLLLPVAFWFEPPLPTLTQANIIGVGYLTLIGAALTYLIWFRGIARLEPSVVATLGFLSPLSAVALGWWWLGEELNVAQLVGVAAVIVSIFLSRYRTLLSLDKAEE